MSDAPNDDELELEREEALIESGGDVVGFDDDEPLIEGPNSL